MVLNPQIAYNVNKVLLENRQPSGECLCKLSYYDDNTENIEC